MQLAENLKKSFQLYNLSLAFSFIGTKNVILEAHDYQALSKHLDFLNFMVVDESNAFRNKFEVIVIMRNK